MDKAIQEFASIIEKGPFKCLRDYDGKAASEYIAVQNEDIGDIYNCAVYQAWLDMCRTVRGAGEEKAKKKYAAARKVAANALRSYFSGKPKTVEEAFDGWFDSVCFDVAAPAGLTVGQTQKIMNMAFKYLYCCDDIRSRYEKHFSCCHMPLDSYILRWYRDNCATAEYHGEVWSKIDDVSMYHHIQNEIREKLGGANVLLQEFSIWQDEKDAAEKRNFKTSAEKFMNQKDCPEKLKCELKDYLDSLD